MAAREYQDEIAKIDNTLQSIEQVLNLPKLIAASPIFVSSFLVA